MLVVMVFVVLVDGRLVEWTGSSGTRYLLTVLCSIHCDDMMGRYLLVG